MKQTTEQKIKFNDFAETFFKSAGISRYSTAARVALRTFEAYSDCLLETVDTAGVERNLEFLSSSAVSLMDALRILTFAVPHGYNEFSAVSCSEKLFDVFGADARAFIAREGSVCLYVRPSKMVWPKHFSKLNADEISFCPDLGAFRVWWD